MKRLCMGLCALLALCLGTVDAAEDRLYAPNYIRYREVLDPVRGEILQEDMSLGDLGFTCLVLEDGGETLVATDLPNVEEEQAFTRDADE